MSIVYSNSQGERIRKIAELDEKVFHARDLANLWQIKNRNTLHMTLARYVKANLLHRIYKGFYSLVPVSKIDTFYLGAKAISKYCYLTTETVLFQHGYISAEPQVVTFVSHKNLDFTLENIHYKCRSIADKYLLNPAGVVSKNKYFEACPERAIADILYFRPTFHFDREPDWRSIKKIQQSVGYPLTPKRYDFT